MTTRVTLEITNNQGYAPDQVTHTITLGDLQEILTEAINSYGEDAQIITHDGGNKYGANYGGILPHEWIAPATDED